MSDLKIAKGLELPLDVVTRTVGVTGQRGTGKTSTAVVIAEEAARAGAQVAAVDPTGAWYGLRSSADGKGPGLDVVVMGGHHGDVKLEETAGHLIADLVVQDGYSVVLDLELMTKGAQLRFMADFAEQLYHTNREALTLIVDEAHRFTPQQLRDPGGYGARCLGAVTDVVTLGRRKGLGCVLISQRPAKINKDVFEQAEVQIVHRLMGPNDRKQIGGWLEDVGDYDAKRELERLPRLKEGEAVVYAPVYDVSDTFKVRAKRTFDSSATPAPGVKRREPVGRAKLDTGKLEERMAATIEKQKREDPVELRKIIRGLERQVEELEKRPAEQETVEVPVLEDDDAARLMRFAQELGSIQDREARSRQEWAEQLAEHLDPLVDRLVAIADTPPAPTPVYDAATVREHADRRARDRVEPRQPARADANVPDGNGEAKPLKAGAKRMLEALLRYRSLNRQQLSTLAVVAKGGTLSDYLSALRTENLIVENGDGIMLTTKGEHFAREVMGAAARGAGGDLVDPPRLSPDDVVRPHLPKLKAGAKRMLDVLMRAHPDGFTRAELSGLSGVAKGGTLSDYLSSLRSKGLIEERARRVYAHPTLYLADD